MKNENIIIRNVEETDFPELGKVYAKAFNSVGIAEEWSPKDAINFLECLYSHQPNIFLVAVLDNRVIGGFVGVIKPFCGKNDLCDTELFVAPDFQMTGAGKQLFAEMLKKAISEHQVAYVQGIADSKNNFPMSWYKKIGLKPTRWVFVSGNAKEMLNNLGKIRSKHA